jgi:hypothetical protein
MMSDLIERLEGFLARRRGMMSVSDEKLVNEVITALREQENAIRHLEKVQGYYEQALEWYINEPFMITLDGIEEMREHARTELNRIRGNDE